MNRLTRLGAALVASVALLALVGGTALAGGWAQATIIDGGGPPVAGEEREIRISLLQHGVTAVDWGQVQLSATPPDGGEEIVVPATSLGGGRWSATVTFPVEGSWLIHVTHSDLATSEPMPLAVGPVDTLGWLAPVIALVAFAAVAAVAVGGIVRLRQGSEPASPGTPREVVRAGG